MGYELTSRGSQVTNPTLEFRFSFELPNLRMRSNEIDIMHFYE
jgi:hypothetical protein